MSWFKPKTQKQKIEVDDVDYVLNIPYNQVITCKRIYGVEESTRIDFVISQTLSEPRYESHFLYISREQHNRLCEKIKLANRPKE